MPRTVDEAFSLSASAETQTTLYRVLGRLDSMLDARDSAVRDAMTDFAARGVDEQYRACEDRWFRASSDLREMVSGLRSALGSADTTARDALARARTVVDRASAR